ncbi:acetyl-CoA acetyltransferase [Sphingomonas sp.]|uniref:acetyl-CoA acetyltransferase n=1 Tax=Sphingomonas sp. TaxID=28214 RepID=UPI003AFFAD28
MDPARTPVIVGVGQANDREQDPFAAMDSVGLMVAALRAADRDAGGGWLARLDSLAVVDQLSFPMLNPVVDRIADALGSAPRRREQTPAPMGDSPIRLLDEAANAIAAGELDVAAVVGGEALRTAARRAAAAAGDAPGDHNAMRGRHGVRAPGDRARYGLVAPVDVYPLYENACRAAWGQSLAEAQAESGAIWSGMAAVAAANPHAWLRAPVTAAAVVTPSAANRPIAFPYTKLQVANSAVNQGAGFIVTSLALARAHGVPDDRLAFVGRGAAAREADDVLARPGFADSGSMRVTLAATLAANALAIDDVDLVELYSCFPCVPKMARRVLGLGVDRAMTLTGGLTFAGGPIGNFMSHAVAAACERLREGGERALLFGNGGFATYSHAIVLSREPGAARPFGFDWQAEARHGPVPPLDLGYTGPAAIESYTVLYARDGSPNAGVVVARSSAGARLLARVPAAETGTIAFLTDGAVEPVGTAGVAVAAGDGLTDWRPA